MTDVEKLQHAKWKEQAIEELKSVDLSAYSYAVDDTDERIGEYIRNVMSAPEAHNLYEILGIVRFFRLLDRHGWNRSRVRHFIKFYEVLRFNGPHGRQRYRLTPIQCFQFASIFGHTAADGRRLTRVAYIFVPRKFSKTTSAASLAVYDMLFGDNNAQAYVGANSYEQAKICFDEIRNIMRDIDPASRHIKVNREKIMFRDRGRDSFIRCLTANAKTQDGLNASLVIMDEYAQARNTAGKNGADLKNVLTSSMGVRRSPLTVIITTASDVIDGPFMHELEGVKRVLKGETESDSMFASLFMPDAADEEGDPATWAKVQPHMGVTVQPDFYEKEWESAQLSAENMLAFRTKLLNLFVVNEKRTWFTYEKALELCKGFNIDAITGFPLTTIAFDLSVHDDFSAVSYLVYSGKSHRFYCHTDYYLPEGSLARHPNEQLYRAWIEQGHLKLCKGDCIDVRRIANDIIRRTKTLKVVRIGYDRYKAKELVNILSAMGAGGALLPYSQTIGNFNLPVETLEMMAYADPPTIEFNNNPINPFCFSNAVIVEDQMENKKPMKISQNRKIDGAITALMCIGLIQTLER